METAVEVFHHFRENILKSDKLSNEKHKNSEFASDVSDDYNSVNSVTSRKSILKRSRSLPQDEFCISEKLMGRNDSRFSHRTHDSGFQSDHPSSVIGSEQPSLVSDQPSGTGSEIPSAIFNSELGSNYLEHYGLNGPLAEYPSVHSDPPQDIEIFEVPLPSATSIGTRRKRKNEVKNATIRQHYYPEGGWGYVVLIVAFLVQILTHGLQLSYGVTEFAIFDKWGKHTSIYTDWLGSLSICISLLISPLTIAICRRKSTRLTAVVGGLITSLGLLFTSFASQFHQLFFSYGIMLGVGVGFARDTSTLMVAQYFKRKRELVEVVVLSGSGCGITIMSLFLRESNREYKWRHGLQMVTGVIFLTFIMGLFYRSATLYHPQRRAILHLKSQKRKIKEKNKSVENELPFFDYSPLASRTFKIILLSTFVTSYGIFTPIIFLVQQAQTEGIPHQAILQTYLGLAWTAGVAAFGLLIVKNSTECRIGRQYLCQTAGLTCGFSVLAFTSVEGYHGYVIFVWIFGVFCGGYNYSLKMFTYEKVRARNFARSWGYVQTSQSLPVCLGVPIAGYINKGCGNKSGFYFSAICIIVGSLLLFLVDIHKSQMRKKRRLKHRLRHGTSIKSTSTNATGDSFASPEHSKRKLSFTEDEDEGELLPALALLAHQQSLIDLIEQQQNAEDEDEDMDIPDKGLLDELEMLDNITSCNVVDNYLMLDEYEQNLLKEREGPTNANRRFRKWSLVRPNTKEDLSPDIGENNGKKGSINNNRDIPLFRPSTWQLKLHLPSSNANRAITTISEDPV